MPRRLIARDAVTQFYDLSRFITAITFSDAAVRALSVSFLIFFFMYNASFVRGVASALEERPFLDLLAEWTAAWRVAD